MPAGRQNLTAILAARCDPEGYGELLLYDIAVEEQVPGPRQVEALVEQDPVISQQFSLWRQGGSQVWSGHLHIVPVGETLLYLEPIFLAAEADAIPELRRFVVSDGRRVAMEETLEEAIAALASPGGRGSRFFRRQWKVDEALPGPVSLARKPWISWTGGRAAERWGLDGFGRPWMSSGPSAETSRGGSEEG